MPTQAIPSAWEPILYLSFVEFPLYLFFCIQKKKKKTTQMTCDAQQRPCPSSSAGSSASACPQKSDAITNKQLEESNIYKTTGQWSLLMAFECLSSTLVHYSSTVCINQVHLSITICDALRPISSTSLTWAGADTLSIGTFLWFRF